MQAADREGVTIAAVAELELAEVGAPQIVGRQAFDRGVPVARARRLPMRLTRR
jgi:hypothetical protein